MIIVIIANYHYYIARKQYRDVKVLYLRTLWMLPSFQEGKEIVSNGMPILESCMSYTTMLQVIGLMLLLEIYLVYSCTYYLV